MPGILELYYNFEKSRGRGTRQQHYAQKKLSHPGNCSPCHSKPLHNGRKGDQTATQKNEAGTGTQKQTYFI